MYFKEIDSTSSELRRMARGATLEPFTSVRADFQTAGRGQVGNRWESEPGKNLLMSVYLKPQNLEVANHFYLTMATSVAIAQCLPLAVKLKWPNDIYVDNKKLAGLLIETTLRGSLIADAIIGMGININQSTFASHIPHPTSVKLATGNEISIEELSPAIPLRLSKALRTLDEQKWDEIKRDYMAMLFRNDGHFYPYKDQNGTFLATITDVEPTGHLILTDESGTARKYSFKEVECVF